MHDEHSLKTRPAPLAMSSDEFRELATQLIDRIADFLDSIPQRPVTRAESPAVVRQALEAPVSYTHLDVYKRQVSCHLLRQPGLRRTEHFSHGRGVCLPGLHLLTQLTAALRGEPIELGLAIVLRESPLRLKQAFVFQSPKSGIKGSLFNKQRVITVPTDEAGDGIPVKRPPNEGLENENVECSPYQFEASLLHAALPLEYLGKRAIRSP